MTEEAKIDMVPANAGPSLPAESPAPWTLKCEAYGIPFRLDPKKLPPGLYHELDTPPAGKKNDDFKGGYGPYDELLVIPGSYGVPGGKYKGGKQLRATRFYVSQRETTYNGRKNWNIPKQLARFEFSEPTATSTGKTPKELKVKVFPYGSDSDTQPFFSCTLSPSRLLPGVPTTTKLLPFTPYLVQPPVGQGKGKGEDPLLYESDHWCGIPLASSASRVRFMKAKIDEPPEEEKINGTHWPAIKTWSFGVWLENATLEFPVSDEFKGPSKDYEGEGRNDSLFSPRIFQFSFTLFTQTSFILCFRDDTLSARHASSRGCTLKSHSIKHGNGRPQKRTVIPNFNVQADNLGTKAWREGKPADANFDLPSGFDPVAHVGALQALRYIEVTTNTQLQLYKRKNFTDSNVNAIKIWGGTPTHVNQALSQLAAYVIKSDASSSSSKKFSKVESDRGWEYRQALHRKLKRDEERQKYRKKLSESEIAEKRFQYSIVVPWKEEHWRVEDVLGQQLEALDEIRMDGMCYINFSRILNEVNFVLLGNQKDKMLKAAERLRAIPYRVASYALYPSQVFLFKPVDLPFDYSAFMVKQVDHFKPIYLLAQQHESTVKKEEKMGKFFMLQPSGVSEGQILGDDVATMLSIEDLEAPGPIWLGIQRTTQVNAQYLHRWVTSALKHLSFYKGHLQMEVAISACVFRRHKHDLELPPAAVEDLLLEANNEEEDLDAFVAPSIKIEHGRVLLERFINNRTLLTFYDNPLSSEWTLQQCLARCHPRLKGVFIFRQGPAGNLRLELEYKLSSEGEFDEISRRWLRLKDCGAALPSFLDVNILDLENPHLSSCLKIARGEILGDVQVNRVKDVHHQFADDLVTNLNVNDFLSADNQRLFHFSVSNKTSALVDLTSYEQCRTWLFSIGMSGYFAELYVCSTVELKSSDTSKQENLRDVWPREERWGIRVFHERWGSLLKENEELAIGEKASWQPNEAQFFPSREYMDSMDMEGTEAEAGAGFLELQRILKIVEDVIKGGKLSDGHVENGSSLIPVYQNSQVSSESLSHLGSSLVSSLSTLTVGASNSFNSTTESETTQDTVIQGSVLDPFSDDETEKVGRAAPNMSKKKGQRGQLPNYKAMIASSNPPRRSADVRNPMKKSFAALEHKLFKPGQGQKKNKKRRRARNESNSQTPRGMEQSTEGAWIETGGPIGHMPKLTSSSGAPPIKVAEARTSMLGPRGAWTAVVKGQKSTGGGARKAGSRMSDEFPTLGSIKN